MSLLVHSGPLVLFGRRLPGVWPPRAAWGRAEALYLLYVVLSTVSLAAFIGFNVWLVVAAST